jgi:hypothetical protein
VVPTPPFAVLISAVSLEPEMAQTGEEGTLLLLHSVAESHFHRKNDYMIYNY